MSSVLEIDRTVDCQGLYCPMPLIKVSKAIKEIAVGQVLEMLADDPGSKRDMEAWVKRTGHELLGVEQQGGVFKFYLRRTN